MSMQIAILNGIYTNESADFRTSYPRNMVPVPKSNGISEGYLRPADGIVSFGTGPGIDRGGIRWGDACYRVMGTKLVRIDSSGTATILGDVGGTGQVTFDYSFDRLSISSGGRLYYWDGTLTQVTDSDVGNVIDHLWVDGYFMATDGQYLIVTELNDPLSVNPLKYGSSEADPDAIKGLLKIRNEVAALNRNTIEFFDNIGGNNFPFQRIEGAQIQKGVIGTHCACIYMEAIAFMGGGRNDAPAIWLGANGNAIKLSSREVDQILLEYTEAELADCLLESRTYNGHEHLYIHLPDHALVYDAASSKELGTPVWFTLSSSISGNSTYRARNFVWCYDKWLAGDPTSSNHGYLTNQVSTHYGETIGWEFGTTIMYNGSMSAIVHELELVALTGRVPLGADPVIWTSYSTDGEVWSQEKSTKAGKQGERNKRLRWMQQGLMRDKRMQKFRGTSDAHVSIARLEARMEPLSV